MNARDLVLAVDVGGTKLETAMVDAEGGVIAGTRHRAPTGPATDAASLDAALRDAIARTLASSPTAPVAAGIGTAGPVDLPAGTTSPLNLPRAAEFPIVRTVAAASGVSDLTLRLDGACIALAETWVGAARGASDALVFVVSTGIGGGILSGGRLLAGGTGNAGHLGQLVVAASVDAASGLDTAGGAAGWTAEGLGSGPHTVAWARRQGWTGDTGEDLAADAAAGDAIARRAVERSARVVGIAVTNVAMLLDIDLAVVGGGFARVSADYTELVERSAHAHAVNAYGRRVRVVPAAAGADAPLIGAAALHWRADLLR